MMWPGAGGDPAAEIGRHAIAPEFALQLARQRQIGAVGEILHPHGEENIGGRHLVGADIDRAHAVGGRPDHDPQRPRLCAFFAEAQRDTAIARAAQAEADIVEGPFVAALLVVDDEIAVLQADLDEVLSVEAGEAEAVEPVEAGEDPALGGVSGRRGASSAA